MNNNNIMIKLGSGFITLKIIIMYRSMQIKIKIKKYVYIYKNMYDFGVH